MPSLEHLTETFQYLDQLRMSGKTNMFGAAEYLRKAPLGRSKTEAREELMLWMKTFGDGSTLPEERAARAKAGDYE